MIDDDDGNGADKIYIDQGCVYIFGYIWIYLDGCFFCRWGPNKRGQLLQGEVNVQLIQIIFTIT